MDDALIRDCELDLDSLMQQIAQARTPEDIERLRSIAATHLKRFQQVHRQKREHVTVQKRQEDAEKQTQNPHQQWLNKPIPMRFLQKTQGSPPSQRTSPPDGPGTHPTSPFTRSGPEGNLSSTEQPPSRPSRSRSAPPPTVRRMDPLFTPLLRCTDSGKHRLRMTASPVPTEEVEAGTGSSVEVPTPPETTGSDTNGS